MLERVGRMVSVERLKRLRDMGLTHVAVNTMNQNLPSPRAHIDRIKAFREAVERL